MKQTITLIYAALTLGLCAQNNPTTKAKTMAQESPALSKISQDRAAIKSLCGIYKVSFNFAETFSSDTAYKFHSPYKEQGIEYVFLAEENDSRIVLQHLLIVNDTIIVKHWRQDWVYENTEVYKYYRDNEWLKEVLSSEQAKGTWTQKVYQVDDSPRYENYGTWVHVDGKHFWEGTNDAPLPRRESTKRSDYNVLRRHNRIELFADGSWALFQDNEKILRKNGLDKVLCWERGVEKFTRGNYDAIPAVKWWESQKYFWADVRKAWSEVYGTTKDLKLADRVDGMHLYDELFDLGDKVCEKKVYMPGSASADIKKIIVSFIKA